MNFKNMALIGAALFMSSPIFASTYYVGFEDVANGDYDYNDVVFSLSGNGLTLKSSGKFYNQPALNNSGTPFWNNLSLDQPSNAMNVGFCIYGGGACNGGKALDPGAQYLASANSPAGTANDVIFSVDGNVNAAVSVSITAGNDSVGWYLASNPSVYGLFGSSSGAGSTYTFTPGGDFGIGGYNASNNQLFYSQTALGTLDTNMSHFAIFSAAPEPGMMGLVAAGLLSVGAFFRRKKSIQS